jgi:hypothetical protein
VVKRVILHEEWYNLLSVGSVFERGLASNGPVCGGVKGIVGRW